jgi:hypothetical protein
MHTGVVQARGDEAPKKSNHARLRRLFFLSLSSMRAVDASTRRRDSVNSNY